MSDELFEMIQGFVEDSHEAFNSIENDLLTFETNPEDVKIINKIFRVMHTIKGTAGFLELTELGNLAHFLESIFDSLRRKIIPITPDLLDQLLPAIDLLKLMVFELVAENKTKYPYLATIKMLEDLSNQKIYKPSDTIGDKPKDENLKNNLDIKSQISKSLIKEIPRQENIDVDNSSVDDSGFEITPQILQEFVVEAEEHLVTIEENLLTLEENPKDLKSINELFRAIHSIKGTADYVRLEKTTRLSHKIETLFEKLRKESLKYSNEVADIVLKSVDLLRTLIFMVKMGDDDDIIVIDEAVNLLNQFLEPQSAPASVNSSQKILKENSKVDPKMKSAFMNISGQQKLIIESIGLQAAAGESNVNDLKILHRSVNTILGAAEGIEEIGIIKSSKKLSKIIITLLAEEKTMAEVQQSFNESLNILIKDISKSRNEEAVELVFASDTLRKLLSDNENQTQNKDKIKAPTEILPTNIEMPNVDFDFIKSMRVETSRLDTFMNLIGELIIMRNSFSHVTTKIAGQKLSKRIMQELKNAESSLNRISDDLQNTLMEIRLVAVKTVFQRIPRIVRDISRKTNKKIQIQMIGENTEIDKSIVELIGDPLLHIIRNSCDHGIETVAKRQKLGKPERGTIILKANHLGSVIEIDIIDDGAGINIQTVKETAIKRGLVSRLEADKLDARSIQNFIFKPGFSTASKVTDISGRGVGMDVVMTNIQRIHGTVEIESEEGQGSKVKLVLPLTLAVIDALIVSDNNQKFAIPLEAVKETIEVKKSNLQHLKQKEAIELRGDIIGVSRLRTLLGMPRSKNTCEDKVLSIVFIQVGNRTIGIVIDDLHAQQEIVVKPLQGYLTRINGVKGSTILGNGEVILILEATELMALASI